MKNIFIKIIAVMMVVVMTVSYLPLSGGNSMLDLKASAGVIGGVAWTDVSLGGNVKWKYDAKNDLITVFGSGNMNNFANGDDGQYWDALWGSSAEYPISRATKIVIEEGITNIGNNAFVGFKELEEVVIPESVKSIGSGAFKNNAKLTKITIPSAVTVINADTFSGCSSLSSINIHSGITSIGANAFNGTKITSVNMPASVKSIGNNAFGTVKITCNYGDPGYTYCQKHSNATAVLRTPELKVVVNPSSIDGQLIASFIVKNGSGLNAANFEVKYNSDIFLVSTEPIIYESESMISAVVFNDDNTISIGIACVDEITYSSCTGACEYKVAEIPFEFAPYGHSAIFDFSATKLMYSEQLYDIPSVNINYGDHVYVQVGNSVAATCTGDGFTLIKCTICGYEQRENVIAALGHLYSKEVIAVTCEEDGFTKYDCSRCGDSYIDDIVYAGGHKLVDFSMDATCIENGKTGKICSVCNAEIVLSNGEINPDNHVNTEIRNSVLATCVENGYTGDTYCADCGVLLSTGYEISAFDHQYVSVFTAPTCESSGYKTHTCETCGDSYKDTYVMPTGHDYVYVETVNPSCTGEGFVTYECSVCYQIYEDTIDAIGHNGVWETVLDAEIGVDGLKQFICENCGEILDEEKIPAIDDSNLPAPEYNSSDKYVSKTDYVIVPGVTESKYVTMNDDGTDRNDSYVLEVDMSNPEIGIVASYKNYMNGLGNAEWGMQALRDQAVAVEDYYVNTVGNEDFEIVAGINGDFFNMGNGAPTGTLVMNGITYNTNDGWPFFALLDDNTVVIGDRDDKLPENAVQVIGGPEVLLINGEFSPAVTTSGYGVEKHPRTAIGVKANGNIIMYVSDGRQSPESCGHDFESLASELLNLGCVDAICLDGGGSSTFISQREGETSLSLRNSPADGIERTVSTGLLIYTNKDTNKYENVSKWFEKNGKVGYYGADGVPVTGEQTIDGFTYTFDANGNLTSFVKVNPDGTLVKNSWVDAMYYLGNDGLPVKGKANIDGNIFRFNSSGVLVSSDLKNYWYKCGTSICYFDANGNKVTGDYKIGTTTYPFDSNGKLTVFAVANADGNLVANQWVGKSYYLGEDGLPLTGKYKLDGYTYTFGTDGKLIKGELKDEGFYSYYYIGGEKQRNWHMIDGSWYYFDRMTGYGMASLAYDGKTSVDTVKDGKYPISTTDARLEFKFDNNGRLVGGAWLETDYGKAYYWGNHERLLGWQEIEGSTYYFNDDTYAVTGYHVIDGVKYEFSDEGKLIGAMPDEHEHDYISVVILAPTCTESGMITKSCACGVSYDEIIPATDHNGVWEIITPAEIGVDGYKLLVCTECALVLDEQIIPAIESVEKPESSTQDREESSTNVYEESSTDNSDEPQGPYHDYVIVVIDPTCTESGYTIYACSDCGEVFIDDIIDATGHKLVWKTIINPGVGTEGLEELRCVSCDCVEKQSTIPALQPGESVTSGYEITADELPEQVKAYFNGNYGLEGYSYSDSTKSVYSIYVSSQHFKLANVLMEGNYIDMIFKNYRSDKFSISLINHYLKEHTTLSKSLMDEYGMDMDSFREVAYPCSEKSYLIMCSTQSEAGSDYIVYTIYMNASEYQKVFVDGNDIKRIESYTTDSKNLIDRTEVISFITELPKNTFTVSGYKETSLLIFYNHLLNHKHTYSSNVTLNPTCTETGVVTYTCSCGNSYEEVLAAMGHDGVWLVVKDADYGVEGLRYYVCKNCNAILDEEIIPPIGDVTEPDVHEHDYAAVVTAPTCTENGFTTYTCECGESYVADETAALGHSLNDNNICDRCGTVFDGKVTIGTVRGCPGDTVQVYISVDKDTYIKSMMIYDVAFDSSKVTLLNGEWLTDGAIISDWNLDEKTGAVAFNENTTFNGDIFCLTFKINEGIDDSKVEIDCNFIIKSESGYDNEEELNFDVISGCINIVNYILGDVNDDEVVDSDDAIYLLYHTLIPSRYPLNQQADFNGSGKVNSNDAIYLLYHVLLPERYPLSEN